MKPLCTLKLLLFLLYAVAPALLAQDAATPLAGLIARHESAVTAPVIDRDAFLAEPTVRQAKLAPDGRHLAYILHEQLDSQLHLYDTNTQTSSLVFSSIKLDAVFWSEDGKRLVLNLGDAIGVLPIDQPDSPFYLARLATDDGDYFIGPDRTAQGGILVARKLGDGTYVLQRTNYTGATVAVLSTAERIHNAFLSRDGSTAFVETITAQERRIRKKTAAGEETLMSCSVLDECRPLAHDEIAGVLWLASTANSNFLHLAAYGLATNEQRQVHSDPDTLVDLAGTTFTAGTPRITQYHPGTVRNYGLDEHTRTQLALISARFPDSNLTTELSHDGTIWLLTEESAVLHSPRFHLYDSASGTFTELFAEARRISGLEESALAKKFPFSYRAGDGLLLHGYVSMPKGMILASTPLVAVIHGGPWSRVDSNFGSLTQLLVNRGYIVFEPNFRSSTGYGRHYVESANRDFGNGVVQQDIIDGIHHLLAQGIGDAERLGIVGASFGGFSVLAGLAFTPDLFKVGVASIPPADMSNSLRYLLEQPGITDRDPSLKEQISVRMADPDDPADLRRLSAKSPLASLSTITAPLLVLAGADDDRVSISHVKDYSLALFNQGSPISVVIDEGEGHGLETPLARRAWFYLTEKMLGLYLQGKRQPLDDPELADYIKRKLLLNSNPQLRLD